MYGASDGFGCYGCDDDHLGLSLPSIGTAVGVIGEIFGGNPKDAQRKADAENLYRAALTGDVMAALRLKCLSGRSEFTAECQRAGLVDSKGRHGFATKAAQDYAYSLVKRLPAIIAMPPLPPGVKSPADAAKDAGSKLDGAMAGLGGALPVLAILGVGLMMMRGKR